LASKLLEVLNVISRYLTLIILQIAPFNMKELKKEKVLAAMSGGVDSSVAAALLKKRGYDVIGVFMKFWAEGDSENRCGNKTMQMKTQISASINRCCSFEAYNDARRVAQKLDIPLYTLNLKIPFKKWVVDYFLKEYQAGRTPNPCIECNRFIKFGELLRKAKAIGADFVATGHYARLRQEILNRAHANFRRAMNELGPKSQIINFKLLKGKDRKKDQSYFLYPLTQEQLRHVLFPVGNYTKSQVRQMAKKFGLPVHAKLESQEICFIYDADVRRFLKTQLHIKNGTIIELETGKNLGEHEGALLYTIGQRKGLRLGGGPWYVISTDVKKNIVYVSRDEKKLFSRSLIAQKVNWISGREPKLPLKVKAKIRYKHKEAPCIVKKIKNDYEIIFNKPQRAITPGQSVVFYKGEEVIGGGIIKKIKN
jgi:tRNA-specific 2-thiouridylase